MSLLGAVLIVKNEVKSIVKTLASLADYVDTILVLDTGSSDGTQDLVANLGVQLSFSARPVRLVLHEEPFSTYAETRNRALELAALHVPTEFTLTISADEVLLGGAELRAYLNETGRASNAGAFCVMMRTGDRQWPFPRVLRTGGGWKYFNTAGSRHEQPGGPKGEIEGPLVPGVHVLHSESDPARKLQRLRETDLPDLTAEVEDESKSLRDRAEAMFQLAETHFILGHNEPPDETGKPVIGGRWLSHKFSALALYNRYAEVMEPHDFQRAMYARAMFCYVAETFGLFEPTELLKRLSLIARAAPQLPEVHWMLAKSASKVDARKAIALASNSAKVAAAVYAKPVHGATDITLEWKSLALAADCARMVKDTRLMHAYAKQALAAGAPRDFVGDLAPSAS